MRVGVAAAVAVLLFLAPLNAAQVGDQVELRATHHLGVPLHRQASSSMFGRADDGTVAEVLEVNAPNGWLRLELPDGRMGWVSPRYVIGVVTGGPPPAPPAACPADAEELVWSSAAESSQVVEAGCRLQKPSGELRAGTWNVRWFPKGCSPGERCEENATDLEWLACTIAWMDVDVLALQEILDDPPARMAMAEVVDHLEAVGGTWKSDLQSCGSAMSQRVGFLWRSDRVTLSALEDAEELNGAAAIGGDACFGNLRPGRYTRVEASGGVDFHAVSVHLDSGTQNRDYQHRRAAIDRIGDVEIGGSAILAGDVDLLVLGDFNTMGREEPPPISAADAISLFEGEIEPGFRRLQPQIPCTEYFRGHGGALDHALATLGMQEAHGTARVTRTALSRTVGTSAAPCRRRTSASPTTAPSSLISSMRIGIED